MSNILLQQPDRVLESRPERNGGPEAIIKDRVARIMLARGIAEGTMSRLYAQREKNVQHAALASAALSKLGAPIGYKAQNHQPPVFTFERKRQTESSLVQQPTIAMNQAPASQAMSVAHGMNQAPVAQTDQSTTDANQDFAEIIRRANEQARPASELNYDIQKDPRI